MTELGTRLQKARVSLKLSQDYVAQQLQIGRSSVSQIELGKRKVTTQELAMFSKIYGLPVEDLLSGKSVEMPSQVFTRKFAELDEADQREILSLMEFKRMMKDRNING